MGSPPASSAFVSGPALPNHEQRDVGVSLRCAPGRAARAVGNDTTVANRAGPTAVRPPFLSEERMARGGPPRSEQPGWCL